MGSAQTKTVPELKRFWRDMLKDEAKRNGVEFRDDENPAIAFKNLINDLYDRALEEDRKSAAAHGSDGDESKGEVSGGDRPFGILPVPCLMILVKAEGITSTCRESVQGDRPHARAEESEGTDPSCVTRLSGDRPLGRRLGRG